MTLNEWKLWKRRMNEQKRILIFGKYFLVSQKNINLCFVCRKISFSVGNDAFRLVRDYHNKQLWGNLVITTTSVDGKRPTTEDVLIPLPPHILNYLQKVGFKIKK